jgi:phosphatidylserine/phosphatidylglycerophosphate/cardiolipin synthase-like enzyme
MKSIRQALFIILFLWQFLFSATGNIDIYFSPAGKPDQKLISLINEARHGVNIAVYSLTKQDIADALVSASGRGVKIRVLTDAQQAGGRNSKDEFLEKYNIPLSRDKHSGLMHHKFAVIDGQTVIAGSYNWTQNASSANDENMLVIQSPELAEIFNAEFERLWAANK